MTSNDALAFLRERIDALEVELAEARKVPVQVLPVVTDAMTEEMSDEWCKPEYGAFERGKAYTAVLRRHFRQAEAEAKQVPPVPGPPSDWQTNRGEPLATFVHRVIWETPRATRRECAEKLRADGAKYGDIPLFWKITADRMERGE